MLAKDIEFLELILEDFEYKYKGGESNEDEEVLLKMDLGDFSYRVEQGKVFVRANIEVFIDSDGFMLELKAVGVGYNDQKFEMEASEEEKSELLSPLFKSLSKALTERVNQKINDLLKNTPSEPTEFIDFFEGSAID